MSHIKNYRRLRRSHGRRLPPASLVIAVVALLVAGGGYAMAAGGGTINACITHSSQVLYVGKCARSDQKLSWNKVGPQGLRGPQGPRGPAGPGATGFIGFVSGTVYENADFKLILDCSRTATFGTVLTIVEKTPIGVDGSFVYGQYPDPTNQPAGTAFLVDAFLNGSTGNVSRFVNSAPSQGGQDGAATGTLTVNTDTNPRRIYSIPISLTARGGTGCFARGEVIPAS
jgi:hypothetical protein